MSFAHRYIQQPALWVGCFACAVLALLGCNNDRACAASEDCFRGEICISGTCEVDGGTTSNTSGSNNSTRNNSSTTNTPNNSTNAGTTNGTNSNPNNTTSSSACLVDLIGNSCDEDEYEENDGYDPGTANWDTTPWESNSWCVGTEIPEPSRKLSGTLCAGDRGDAYRFVVANNGPVCITSDFTTFRMLVEIKTACDPSLIRVEPYTFGRDPIRNDLCADDDNVRCTVTNNGLTHEIEWVWPAQQIYDPRVQIMSEAQNLQVDYDITFEVMPQ